MLRASQMLHETGVARSMETHTVGVSSAHVHAPLSHWASLTKHTFKDGIIKNVKRMTMEHEISVGRL